jgi:hypothetical protein
MNRWKQGDRNISPVALILQGLNQLFCATCACCSTSTTASRFLSWLFSRFFCRFFVFSLFGCFLVLYILVLFSVNDADFTASATFPGFLLRRSAPGTRFAASTTCSLGIDRNTSHACNEAGDTHSCQDGLHLVLLHDKPPAWKSSNEELLVY